MTKIVINRCFGGFGLSEAAVRAYYARKGKAVFVRKLTYGQSYYDEAPPVGYGPIWFDAANKDWLNAHYLDTKKINRDDPDLVAVIEELSDEVSGRFANLQVVEIPDDVLWQIEEYDGMEWIAEQHRTWP